MKSTNIIRITITKEELMSLIAEAINRKLSYEPDDCAPYYGHKVNSEDVKIVIPLGIEECQDRNIYPYSEQAAEDATPVESFEAVGTIFMGEEEMKGIKYKDGITYKDGKAEPLPYEGTNIPDWQGKDMPDRYKYDEDDIPERYRYDEDDIPDYAKEEYHPPCSECGQVFS